MSASAMAYPFLEKVEKVFYVIDILRNSTYLLVEFYWLVTLRRHCHMVYPLHRGNDSLLFLSLYFNCIGIRGF